MAAVAFLVAEVEVEVAEGGKECSSRFENGRRPFLIFEI